jgi:predicted DNA binding protein
MTETASSGGSAPVVEVEFRTQNPAHPFVRGSEVAACTFDLAKMVPRRNGEYAEFFAVLGADSDQVASLVDGRESLRAESLVEYEDGALFEFVVSENCPARHLAELGALPQTVRATDGTGRIVADVPPQCDAPAVTEAFLADNPEAELVTKREKESVTPPVSWYGMQQALQAHLTDRQLHVVRTAFEEGYYDWPRECTGEDVARELGISSATFSEHVRTVERKLVSMLFQRAESVERERP